MNSASDEELLAAHLHGDRTAFGKLVARHERRIYGLCLRVLGSREDAEDATQEAFLAALRRAASFRGEAAFSTWLFRIAVNAATDQARRRGRTRAVPLETGEPAVVAPIGGDPGSAVPDTMMVQAALQRVSEDFRATLVLCDLYGFPYAQAAEILGLPVGTVKSRLFRARLALGLLLAKGEDPSVTGVVREPGTQAVVGASEPADPERLSKEE